MLFLAFLCGTFADRLCAVGGRSFNGTILASVECTDVRVGGQALAWTEDLPPMLVPRYNFGSTYFDSEWIFCAAGGFGGIEETTLAEVECFNGSTWQAWPEMNVPREGLGLGVFGSKLYAAGGFTSLPSFRVLTSYEVLENGNWTLVFPFTSRYNFALYSNNFSMCAMGGRGTSQLLDSMECFDGEQWVEQAPMLHPRSSFAAAKFEQTTLFGTPLKNLGLIATGPPSTPPRARADIYDEESGTWQALFAVMAEPRSWHTLSEYRGLLCAMGGILREDITVQPISPLECLRVATVSPPFAQWITIGGSMITPRYGHGAIAEYTVNYVCVCVFFF